MKPFLIHFWHGRSFGEHKTFMKKVHKLCRLDAQNNYYWDGTLDAFAFQWGEKFIFLPAAENEKEYILGRICITPLSGFGQR